MNISFRKLTDAGFEFKKLHKWCSQKFVYEWFEQRILSYDEIVKKYQSKLNAGKQELLILQCDGKDIGLAQLYKFEYDIKLDRLKTFKNIYEFDLYIGEENYLSKGIGTIIINKLTDYIYNNYDADAIILRPFKRNIRAIKCYQNCNYETIDEYEGKDTLNNPEIVTVLLNKRH